METGTTPWMSGNTANAQSAGIGAVADMAGAIFTSVGGNRYARPARFKADDVVVLETARDNRLLIAGAGTVVLAIVVLIMLGR